MKLKLFVLLGVSAVAWFAVAQEPAQTESDEDRALTTRPTEIRRGIELKGSREERARRAYEQIIRKVEPSLVGVPERLPQYVDLFKREFVEDTRTFAINISASLQAPENALQVSGWAEFDEHRRALKEYFTYLGFKNQNADKLELLPAKDLGETAYAIVGDEPVFVYDRVTTPRETFTEMLPGEALFVLKDVGEGQLLCHAPDGYVGFVDGSKLKRVTGEQFDAHLKQRWTSSDRAERIEKAIATAQTYLGTKYVWGGRTKDGIDCSGLVHASCRSAGVFMPRDADQQSLVGSLVATRWHKSSMQRGDVMFFLGRRGTISHTALYLGDGKYIEAATPVVRISTLEEIPPRPRSAARRKFLLRETRV